MCCPACSPLLGSGAGALQPWGEGVALGPHVWPRPWRRKGWELVIPSEVGPEDRSRRLFDPLRGQWVVYLAVVGVAGHVEPTGPGTSHPSVLLCLLHLTPAQPPATPPCPTPPRPTGQQSPHWPTPQVYVLKRPHVDEFLQRMGELFECVLFTASLAKVSPPPSAGLPGHLCFLSASDTQPLGRGLWVPLGAFPAPDDPPPAPQYADPVADLLDKWGAFRARLFRESCVFHRGNYVKDLSRLGRDLRRVLILDNSPASYVFHPDNAVSARQDGGWSPVGVCSLPFLPLFSSVAPACCPLALSIHSCPRSLISYSAHSACMYRGPAVGLGPLLGTRAVSTSS